MLAAAGETGIDTGLVELDIGLRIETDANRAVIVRTSGYGLRLTIDGDVPDELGEVVELVPVRERLADG